MRTKQDYTNYLKSDKWRELSSTVRHERGNKCEFCGRRAGDTILHCHHLTYERFGGENKSDLLVLCEQHHSQYHSQFKAAEMPAIPVEDLKQHVFDVISKPIRTKNPKANQNTEHSKLLRNATPLGLRVSDHSASLRSLKNRRQATHAVVQIRSDADRRQLKKAREIAKATRRSEEGRQNGKDPLLLAKKRSRRLQMMVDLVLAKKL